MIAEGEELLLSAYAERTADRVWAVSVTSLLGALDAGRDLAEFVDFLTRRAETELPSSMATLLDDVTHRARQLADLGYARVIECADPAVAVLIANDHTLRGLCRQLGERHLSVPLESELEFRTALRRLGYVAVSPTSSRTTERTADRGDLLDQVPGRTSPCS